ncbi:MAG: TrkH family potassium uptake protein [Clostridia bacterium]|jgi:trk system potassium uptake protein TrkH|nr:TrkH family potassium uptake protein [Clostridia bacterium]
MNLRLVFKSIGLLLICEAIALIPSLVVALIYKEHNALVFFDTIGILFCVAVPLCMITIRNKNMYARDGYAIVALGWIFMSLFGALPFYFSGTIPSFIDCFFETSSGFTTTGASILTNIEAMPKSILFWRSFTHWIGGMGVIVLTLAILPSLGARGIQMMKAESPGLNPGKLVPKVGETAKILYGIYVIITIVEVSLLVLAGMPLFDSFIHTFGTVGTGGFSSMNASVGAYNNVAIELIITVFMFLSGVNFTLYYYMLKGNLTSPFKDAEFKFYLGTIAAAILFITLDINANTFHNIWESLRHSSFQVVSIITTTGYVSTDFEKWSMFSKIILFMIMFIGACSGSTGGGMKSIRILVLFKVMKRELLQIIHPRAVYSVRIGKKAVDEKTLSEVLGFFFMYIIVFIAGVLIVSLDNMDWGTTISSVAATLSNIGPGFGVVGAVGNYSTLSDVSKVTLSLIMIIGRLEVYPILLLSMPSFWKRVNI